MLNKVFFVLFSIIVGGSIALGVIAFMTLVKKGLFP